MLFLDAFVFVRHFVFVIPWILKYILSPLHVFLLHFLSELVTQQRKFHIERLHNRAICLARSGDLKFMKLGMGQLAMCWCRVPIFSTVWIWKREDVVLQHCWWGKGKAGVNCVRIERKRGGSPQGTASLASQRKIPLAGQASHTLSFFVTTGIVARYH